MGNMLFLLIIFLYFRIIF